LYSACGSVWAELLLPQDVRARHEIAKRPIIKWTSSGDDLRRKAFMFFP
jgi:hypothetical protein